MSPTALTAAALLAGLVAVAAALYALQRLRVRHESRTVVTSLFWREATEETRARSLFERFRHPLAYAMALLCAGLLWLGAGRLDGERADGTRHVFLLDASAGMGRDAGSGTRFDLAVDALEAELADAPRDRTEVLWCGAHVRTLLAPGEDRSLLRPRLAGRLPDPAPASVGRALRSRSAEADVATSSGSRSRRSFFSAPSSLEAAFAGSAPVSPASEPFFVLPDPESPSDAAAFAIHACLGLS